MKRFIRFIISLSIALLLLNVFIVRYFHYPYPLPLGPRFSDDIRSDITHEIESKRSEIVLLGNSSLGDGVDEAIMQSMLGMSIYKIARYGSAAPLWYLMIKNEIGPLNEKPLSVIILFRDTELTLPIDDADGRIFEMLDEFAGTQDDLVIQLSFVNQMNGFQKVIAHYLPILQAASLISRKLENRIRYLLPSILLHSNPEEVESSIDSAFSSDRKIIGINDQFLRRQENPIYLLRNMDFSSALVRSYLPEIITLSREIGVRLIFVRLPSLHYKELSEQPEELMDYIQALKEYLVMENITFLDFSFHPEITAELFADEAHLNSDGKIVFSRILSEALLEELP